MSISVFERVFVTVGTTEFEGLISRLNSQGFLDILLALGCKQICIQVRFAVSNIVILESFLLVWTRNYRANSSQNAV
jgi:hypothetical protein